MKKKNSPRAQTTRLASFGAVLVITGFPVVYFAYYSSIYYKTLVIIKKTQKKDKKNSLMAQATCLASFGPVSIVPAQSITHLVIKAYMYSSTFVSIEKKRRKKKEKLTYGPNDASGIV